MTNMYSVQWTRNDSISLGQTAMQCGLTADEAEAALMLGARMHAHGFSDHEMVSMILWRYGKRVEIEDAVNSGTASPSQFREYRRLKGLEVKDD